MLANVLNVKVPAQAIQNATTAAGTKQLSDMLSNSVDSSNTVDNSALLKILDQLAKE